MWDQLSSGVSSRGKTAAIRSDGSSRGGDGGGASQVNGAGDGKRATVARAVVPVADSLGVLGPDATLRSVAMVTLSVDSIDASSVRKTVVDSATGSAAENASPSSSVSRTE